MRPVRARMRAVWLTLRRGKQLDAAMQEEMRFHIDMEAERLIRERRLDPREARRQAHAAFGGIEVQGARPRHEGAALARHSVARCSPRRPMLIKHRGLTLVGGLAMAVAIAIGATAFEVFNEILDPLFRSKRESGLLPCFTHPTPGAPSAGSSATSSSGGMRSSRWNSWARSARLNTSRGRASTP